MCRYHTLQPCSIWTKTYPPVCQNPVSPPITYYQHLPLTRLLLQQIAWNPLIPHSPQQKRTLVNHPQSSLRNPRNDASVVISSIHIDDEPSIDGECDDFPIFEDDSLFQNSADGVMAVPPIISMGSWLGASLLPRYIDQISIDSTMSVADSIVSCFSIYMELRDASLDEDFEKVKVAMMTEWTYVGACVSGS